MIFSCCISSSSPGSVPVFFIPWSIALSIVAIRSPSIKMIKDCDQILPHLRKIDSSLVKSHNIFKSYMSLMDN